MKITKAVLDAIEPQSAKIDFLRDTELQGFGVRVTPGGAKSFFAERKMSGKTVRHTIGRVGPWTVQQARAEAMQVLAMMDRGINPNASEPAPAPPAPPQDLSLAALLEAYILERSSTVPAMKPRTAKSYRSLIDRCFDDWKSRPFTDISRAMIAERMAKITKDGPTQANNAFRALRAVLNWAIENESYVDASGAPLYESNPIAVLSKRRLWNKDRRLTRLLNTESMADWWEAVDTLSSDDWPERADVMRDFWRLVLFTGMRPGEASRIELLNWNPRLRELVVEDPKNREEYFVLPLGNFAAQMLEARAEKSRQAGSAWLFPAPRREAGYTSFGNEIRQAMNIACRIKWTLSDLRRTFASTVERLEVSSYMLKRVLGHKSQDVTGGYVQHSREQVRDVMQRVENSLLESAKVPLATALPGLNPPTQ